MTRKKIKNQIARLERWINGTDEFFINGTLGHKISIGEDHVYIFESDGAGESSQESIIIKIDEIDSAKFIDDEYKFRIIMNQFESYEIEAYDLQRVEFPE